MTRAEFLATLPDWRAAAVVEVAHYRPQWQLRESVRRGVERAGRTWIAGRVR